MAGLQRSAVSFRRQGSSGLVWDDKFLKELNQEIDNSNSKQKEQEQAAAAVEISSSQQDQQEQQQQPQVDVKPPRSVNTTIERSRSNGGGGGAGARGYRTGRVSPAIEPPSPRVSACGFCSAFANKPPKNNTHAKRTGKRRSRPF